MKEDNRLLATEELREDDLDMVVGGAEMPSLKGQDTSSTFNSMNIGQPVNLVTNIDLQQEIEKAKQGLF